MPVKVSVQRVYRGAGPSRSQLQRWARQALATRRTHAALTVRIVDIPESAALNAAWRQRSGPTNVLSFPVSGLEEVAPELLGDIVICAPLVTTEAAAQGKLLEAHWAHLVVHGTLHLLGFDHVEERQARVMEALECELLTDLGFPDPYQDYTSSIRP
jgi:probable rRNA maturation factor